MQSIKRITQSLLILLVTLSSSFAASSGDPLSSFLSKFERSLQNWGLGIVLISFVGVCIAVAFLDEKIIWLKRLGWICLAGALMIGASKLLNLFGISGACF